MNRYQLKPRAAQVSALLYRDKLCKGFASYQAERIAPYRLGAVSHGLLLRRARLSLEISNMRIMGALAIAQALALAIALLYIDCGI